MKIVRIVTTNKGGAGICVQRLHKAASGLGIDEKVFIAEGDIDESTVCVTKDTNRFYKHYLLRKFNNLLIKLNIGSKFDCINYQLSKQQKKNSVLCTSPFSEYKRLRLLVDYENADIINFHWISNFVDFSSFFKNIKTPIVWSLHDENPARGCLHYDTDVADLKKLDEKVQQCKVQALKDVRDLYVVVQSQYMKKVCENSPVLNRFPIAVIPNGVNPDDFVLLDKKESRKKLGIPEGKKIYMFSSVVLEDKRKGLVKVINALERFEDDNIVLLCVGGYKEKPVSSKIDIHCFGYVSDYSFYSVLYSAASFFIHASSYESFAKTPLEAMSCGTPVIAFPCSGTHDCIREFNGIICEDFSENALFEGIVIANKREYNYLNIRNYVKENFTFELMARRYLSLYRSILCQSNS